MDISVIIVHYNTPQLTENCIRSLINETTGIEYEIIVVDNASTVHDSTELQIKFPRINLIKSEENLGFAKGNNLGIGYAKGKYILLLNSDIYLKQNALLKAYNYIEKNLNAGVVTIRLLYPDGTIQSSVQRFPSLKYSLIQLFRLQKIGGRKISGRLLLGSFFNQRENVKADWVWGAFFMFRKNILNELPNKQLDQTYFMYCEDMQWCMDIKKLGYEIHFCCEAEVVHCMGGSNANKQEMMKENLSLFMKKNYSKFYSLAVKKIEKLLILSQRKGS